MESFFARVFAFSRSLAGAWRGIALGIIGYVDLVEAQTR